MSIVFVNDSKRPYFIRKEDLKRNLLHNIKCTKSIEPRFLPLACYNYLERPETKDSVYQKLNDMQNRGRYGISSRSVIDCSPEGKAVYKMIEKYIGAIVHRELTEQEYMHLLSASPEDLFNEFYESIDQTQKE